MSMEFPVNLPPFTVRMATPIRRGNFLVLSGELVSGQTRINLVSMHPWAQAEQFWRGFTRSVNSVDPTRYQTPPMLREVITEDGIAVAGVGDVEGILEDIGKFASGPLGNIAQTALSFVPGLNRISSTAFGAAKLLGRGKAKKGGQPRR